MMALTTKQKIRIAQLLSIALRTARKAIGRSGDIVDVRRKGINWRLDLREGIDLSIYLAGAFEVRTVRAYSRLVASADIVLDIGANIGAHTLQFARLVGPAGHVYAFEPTQYAYRKLSENISLNPLLAPIITATQTMLVAKQNAALQAEIYSSWPVSGEGDRHEQHQGALKSTAGAAAKTLDEYLADSGIAKIDFVKLDVDGHECDVLEGWTTIGRYKPKIIMELAPYEEHGRPLGDLLSLLSEKSYGFYMLGAGSASYRPDRMLDPASLAASIRAGASLNVVAIPR
jgi:FkbM family methyltransferase